MRFEPSTDMICGRSCATSYDNGASWGLGLSFVKPYIDDREDFKLDEVETSQGKIYLKMRITPEHYYNYEHYGKDVARDRVRGPGGIEHYTCAEVIQFANYCHAKVGMCLAVDMAESYGRYLTIYKERLEANKYDSPGDKEGDEQQLLYYQNMVDQYKKQQENVEKSLEGILLYKSIPFYNLVHHERKNPSCTLYIYDKEMKNAIPSGV